MGRAQGRISSASREEPIPTTAGPLDRAYVEHRAAFWDVVDRWEALTAAKKKPR